MEPSSTMKCEFGHVAACLCQQEGCLSHAIICGTPECESIHTHFHHATVSIDEAIRRLPTAPRLTDEPPVETTSVTDILKEMQDRLQRLDAKHENFLSGRFKPSWGFDDVRLGLLGKAILPPGRVTGGNVCKMMAELEILKNPYPSSKERVLEDLRKI